MSDRIIGSEKILTCKAMVDMAIVLQAKDAKGLLEATLRNLYHKVATALAGRKDLLTERESRDAYAMEYEFRALILGQEDYHYIKALEAEVVELRDQVDFLLGVKK